MGQPLLGHLAAPRLAPRIAAKLSVVCSWMLSLCEQAALRVAGCRWPCYRLGRHHVARMRTNVHSLLSSWRRG